MDFWKNFCAFIKSDIPDYLVKLLIESGFDCPMAIEQINTNSIVQIEQHIEINLRHLLIATVYENEKPFSFRMGHRLILLNLNNQLHNYNLNRRNDKSSCVNHSFMLAELIKTSERNYEKQPNQRRFSETIRCFAAYLYMMCGKSGYEFISANLPLPQPDSIRK